MANGNVHPAARYLKAVAIVLVLSGGELAPVSSAGAQSAKQIGWCNGDDHATPELMISGCTALIQSKKYSGRNLAVAYTNRGSAYDDERDEDQAIADHNQAIQLDPKFGLAYRNRGNAKRRKGDFDGAVADFNRAMELGVNFNN